MLLTVGLQLPVFPRVPYLVCDLAYLMCTIQIKVVSLIEKSIANTAVSTC